MIPHRGMVQEHLVLRMQPFVLVGFLTISLDVPIVLDAVAVVVVVVHFHLFVPNSSHRCLGGLLVLLLSIPVQSHVLLPFLVWLDSCLCV